MKKRRGRPPKFVDKNAGYVPRSSGRAALVERAAAELERRKSEPKPGQVKVTRKDGSIYWRAPRGSKMQRNETSLTEPAANVKKTPKSITAKVATKIGEANDAIKAAGVGFEIQTCDNCKHRLADAKKCPGCGKKMCEPCARKHGNLCDECHQTPD